MPNYKLLLEYDGTSFVGWQRQNGLRTVQGDLEHALEVLLKEKTTLYGAGRTDTGVHARGQVANFRTGQTLDHKKFASSLNALTQADITVRRMNEVPDDFHARFSAVAREYAYFISPTPLSIGRRYTLICKYALDFPTLQKAAACVVGEHNFAAFSKNIPREKHYKCRVESARWLRENGFWVFRIKANRFLHSMVRIMVGTLLNVGRDKIHLQAFEDMLHSQKKNRCIYKAPALGLFLEKVYY